MKMGKMYIEVYVLEYSTVYSQWLKLSTDPEALSLTSAWI